MSDPLPRGWPGPRLLYRYEVRIRTRLGPALTATFPCLAEGAVVPRHAVRRLAVIRDGDDAGDLPEVVLRLTECDVAVLDARLCQPSIAPEDRAP